MQHPLRVGEEMDQDAAAADRNNEVAEVQVAIGTGANASTRFVGLDEGGKRAWDRHRLIGHEHL